MRRAGDERRERTRIDVGRETQDLRADRNAAIDEPFVLFLAERRRDDHEMRHHDGHALERRRDVLHADHAETRVVEQRDARAGDPIVEGDEHRRSDVHSRHRLGHALPSLHDREAKRFAVERRVAVWTAPPKRENDPESARVRELYRYCFAMEPRTRTRSVVTTIAGVAALALGGCNALLDNRPADLQGDVSATDPAVDADAGRGAGGDADASVPDPALGPGADSGGGAGDDSRSPQCLVETKPCGDVCVSIADPEYGCAGPTCERCAPEHGAAACVAGQCALAMCATGWANCNHLASDGCETDLASATSCGACGVTCPSGPHATSACLAGACSLQCAAGFGDCNRKAADGCETQLLKDKHNCGVCGQTCLVGSCEAGTCVLKP